ncbi:oxygenase MpaB family protein [Herbiconiux sp. A18JL235]|uniref:Oxygenase MpaB family protein n=1 Tax=Herbiconiux sp. A18JL235 TaxID=3152363 RepID=A0AB39BCU2_9MICO
MPARLSLADVAPESFLLAGAGRAILLQIAHPAIGYGVAEHSDFAARPMKRLTGTLSYIYALSNGSPDEVRLVRDAVNRAHAPVRSEPGRASGAPAYDARDPELQRWVAATIYDTAVLLYERAFGRLDEASADRVYREYARLGTTLQMPEGLWPPDRAAFRRYVDETVASLRVDATVRGVADALLRAENAPLWMRAGMPLARFVTVGLLPTAAREQFGFDWDETRARRLDRLLDAAAPVYRVLPPRIRRAPQRHHLARLRAWAGEQQPAPA